MHVIYYSDWSMWGDPYNGALSSAAGGTNPEIATPNVSLTNSDRQTVSVLTTTTVAGIEVSVSAKTAGTMIAKITNESGTPIPGTTVSRQVDPSPSLRPP